MSGGVRSQRMLTTFSLLSLQVDREEFEVLKPKLRRYAAEKASAEFPRQWEVFQELDEDGTGTLSTDEVFDFLAGKDESVAHDLMTELDQNHDGALPPPPPPRTSRCSPQGCINTRRLQGKWIFASSAEVGKLFSDESEFLYRTSCLFTRCLPHCRVPAQRGSARQPRPPPPEGRPTPSREPQPASSPSP